jgi:hypothetical protein
MIVAVAIVLGPDKEIVDDHDVMSESDPALPFIEQRMVPFVHCCVKICRN